MNSNTDTPTAIGFTCEICGNTQTLTYAYQAIPHFAMCDQCKKDFKEIVFEKRKKELHIEEKTNPKQELNNIFRELIIELKQLHKKWDE